MEALLPEVLVRLNSDDTEDLEEVPGYEGEPDVEDALEEQEPVLRFRGRGLEV